MQTTIVSRPSTTHLKNPISIHLPRESGKRVLILWKLEAHLEQHRSKCFSMTQWVNHLLIQLVVRGNGQSLREASLRPKPITIRQRHQWTLCVRIPNRIHTRLAQRMQKSPWKVVCRCMLTEELISRVTSITALRSRTCQLPNQTLITSCQVSNPKNCRLREDPTQAGIPKLAWWHWITNFSAKGLNWSTRSRASIDLAQISKVRSNWL